MAVEKKRVTFTLSGSEKAFYDAGKMDGQITTREELADYLDEIVTMATGGTDNEIKGDEKTREEMLSSLGAVAGQLRSQSDGGKKMLAGAIESAINRSRIFDRLNRAFSFAVSGAKTGWRGR